MRKKILFLPIAAITAAALTGCAMGPSETGGTLIGAGSGAALGAVAGNNIRGISSTEGAVAGALVGGLVGNRMGNQQDQINQIRRDQYYRDYYGRPYPPPPPRYYPY